MLVYGQDERVLTWISTNLFNNPDHLYGSVSIGIEHDGKLICGVAYNNFSTKPDNSPLLIEMTIYSVDKRWCNRHNLNALFGYPFIQLGVERVQALSSLRDEAVSDFLKRLGFTLEGYHRSAYADGTDALSWGMLKSECKWVPNGKQITIKNSANAWGVTN